MNKKKCVYVTNYKNKRIIILAIVFVVFTIILSCIQFVGIKDVVYYTRHNTQYTDNA